MNSDGSGLRNLTPYSAVNLLPTWSPDGQMITFVRADPEHLNESNVPLVSLWVMGADGSGPRKLAAGGQPAWQPAAP
jgi:Tol biopolymer transport system component